MYIYINVLLSSSDFLPFSHWLITELCDGQHKKVARTTCDMRAASCRPLVHCITAMLYRDSDIVV
jgi:hypothetical protein